MTEINMKSLKVNRMTKEEVDKVFEYASKEILDGYMFMHHNQGYLYFKHKITRGYIEIPDWTITNPQGGNNGRS